MKISSDKKVFSAKRIVTIGMFVAISYIVSLFEFPIFPATPYLKLDFGNVFILLAGFLFGPVAGIITCMLKEILCLIGTTSGGAGQVANVIVTISYIVVPSVVYSRKKGIKTVFTTLFIACIMGILAALCANRFIIFPMYMGEGAAEVFRDAFWYVTLFNIIKTSSVSVLTILLYKRLSNFIKKI